MKWSKKYLDLLGIDETYLPKIVNPIDKVGVVEIPQNMFVATCRDVKNNCTLFCQNDWVKTEVIGNIYENPELLKDRNNDNK